MDTNRIHQKTRADFLAMALRNLCLPVLLSLIVFSVQLGTAGNACALTLTRTPTNAYSLGPSAWTDPTYALTQDGAYAYWNAPDQTYLVLTGYDFSSIPDNARIDGFTVTVRGGHTTSVWFFRDYIVGLTKNGTTVAGTFKDCNVEGSCLGGSSLADFSNGWSTDKWGTTWTPADIKSPDFGILFTNNDGSTTSSGSPPGFRIDVISITVHYTVCTPSGSLSVTAGQSLNSTPVDLTSISSYSNASSQLYSVKQGSPSAITIGSGGPANGYGLNFATGTTAVDESGPATANGTISQVRFHANSTGTLTVFTAWYNGTNWIPRAKTNLTVSATGFQTAAVSLAVQAGDILGYYSPDVQINCGTGAGAGVRASAGDSTAIGFSFTAPLYTNYRLFLAGTGTGVTVGITMGYGASAASYGSDLGLSTTSIDVANPANASGIITEVQFKANTTGTMTVFTASYTGTNWTPRAKANLTVSTTGYQTAPVSLEVKTGDVIGYYSTTVLLDSGTSGGTGVRSSAGDSTVIGKSHTATLYANYRINLAATGARISIGAGSPASGNSFYFATDTTSVDLANPANASGTVTQVQFNANTTGTMTVFTASHDGTNWKIRAKTTLTVSATGYQTAAVSLAVQAGDLLGYYSTDVQINYGASGGTGVRMNRGDLTGSGIPYSAPLYTNYRLNLGGTGAGITLGYGASASSYGSPLGIDNTVIDEANPAAGNGTISQVQFHASSTGTMTVFTASYDGTNWVPRARTTLTVTNPGYQTAAVNLAVQAGDVLGYYSPDVRLNYTITGGTGIRAESGDRTAVSSSYTAPRFAGYRVNLAATGTTGATVFSGNNTQARTVSTAGWTDGGTYSLFLDGVDATCATALSRAVDTFVWNSCVDSDLATLSITAPAEGATIKNSYTFQAQVSTESSPANMTNVQFYINGAWKNGSWNGSTSRWEYTSVTATDYPGSNGAPVADATLRVRGNDPDCANPTITSSPDLSITVDNTDADPATLAITNPANGNTVAGTVTVQVQVGVESAPVTMADMKISIPAGSGGTAVSGAAMAWNGSSSRWEYSWNTASTHPQIGVAAGGVTINVQGDDPDLGNTVNAAQITVTVDNRVNATRAGTATAVAAFSGDAITVTMPYTEDKNGNNTYTVEYKLTSEPVVWTSWVAAAAHTASPYSTIITGLAPLTSYDVRVTYNDADGILGTAVQSITVVTPAPDSSPPDPITITSATTEVGAKFLRISWTATGDDLGDLAGSGKSARSYDLRYAKREIVESGATASQTNWASATSVVGEPTPKAVGGAEYFDVIGLQSNTTYYFAIKATDDVGNVSALSNSPSGKTGLLTGWNMVSSPVTPVPADTATVFGDDSAYDWMFYWTPAGVSDPTTNGSWTQATSVVRDQGLLLFSKKSNDPTDAPGGSTVNVAPSTNIALSAGYNLIGTPYNGIVNLSSCEVSDGGAFVPFATAVGNNWIDSSIWIWDGTSYVQTAYNGGATLEPWKAYWLLSLQNGITLKVYLP